MLVTNLAHMDRFQKGIENCKSNVFLRMDDGTERNLKQDSFLVQTLGKMQIGAAGLDLQFEDRKDLMSFMNTVYDTYQE